MTPQKAPVRLDAVATADQAVVKTSRLTLRPVRRSDMGLIDHYAGDLRVSRMTTTIPHPLPPGATDAFVTRCMSDPDGEIVWVMDAVDIALGELVGLISLHPMDRNQAEIGYWVAPSVWGKGLGSEAVTGLMQANPLGNAQVFGKVFQDNPPSARVLTNAGFDYIGDAEAFSVARGAIVPQWTYIRQMT
ncbi:GNAT family N-acetyltransferase [Jannaschia sp. M317]|uniref:GNAT family N-acetyltransferase n=1 Tax=Jannaschia sp. M317 TaxID=2867011 RepID=UPI0021A879D7|nr:GNAT family N-acetyltransferase [Jannaschia sp. M317]UWQ16830.1 GNAT family N-acetyltransferase [Jannaschia sp. M317]